MTHFRTYRNNDSPALAALWNRGAPDASVARPLSVHEFETRVVGNALFEASGLIVAEREGRIVAFVHAGFGPDENNQTLHLSHALGTVGMMVVEPGCEEAEMETRLIAEAEAYLRRHGAQVIYAGGQNPLNPFYWGIYGGSEWAGILGEHTVFHHAVARAGFEPVSTTLLMEANLTEPEPRDPRAVLMRRQVRIDVTEDALPSTWWQSVAIGEFRPTNYRLVAKSDNAELARASTWEMIWFGRRDGLTRVGLFDVEVQPGHRRKGYGKHLVNEILRLARVQSTSVMAVQTRSTNGPAIALYQSLGFRPIECSILYRLPGGSTTLAAIS